VTDTSKYALFMACALGIPCSACAAGSEASADAADDSAEEQECPDDLPVDRVDEEEECVHEPEMISLRAAACAAFQFGLERGERSWTAAIACGDTLSTSTWMIENTLVVEGSSSSGRTLNISGTRGEVLQETLWEKTP
jgi:hypothetical protein